MSIITLMSQEQILVPTIIDGEEYFISDNVFFSVYEYDIRWYEIKRMVNTMRLNRHYIMDVNTYPTNPRMFISYLTLKDKATCYRNLYGMSSINEQ